METLTLGLDGDEGAVPVFSSEEEAVLFLGFEAPAGAGWKVMGTTAPGLASELLSLSAERVALDPLPTKVGGEELVRLLSLDRERFLMCLGSDPGLSPSSWIKSRRDDDLRPADERSAQQMGEGCREVAARNYHWQER